MEIIAAVFFITLLVLAFFERDRIRLVKIGNVVVIEFFIDLREKRTAKRKKADVATIDLPSVCLKAESSRQGTKKDTLPN